MEKCIRVGQEQYIFIVQVIPAFEMVMRARTNVYHLECFACQQCGHRYILDLIKYRRPIPIIFVDSSSLNGRQTEARLDLY